MTERETASAARPAAQLSPRGYRAPAPHPRARTANSKGWPRFWIELALGFAVLVLCTLAGEEVKRWMHLPIPGNVLGLFILLLCFRLRLIPAQLIEEASNRVLFVLPALFIPIYVSAIGGGQLWSKMSYFLLPTLLVVTAILWMFVGHLAQHLLLRSPRNE